MIADHITEAVVLKSIDYSETSLIVRLFTADFGKVTVMAKGARRSRQATGSLLQPPNQLSITYRHKDGRDMQTLIACEYAARFPNLSDDMIRSAAAMMAIEMLDRATGGDDPQPLVFRLIAAILKELDHGQINPLKLTHFYQLHLARQLGFAPHLDNCIHCGRPLQSAVVESVAGHLSCESCRPAGSRFLDQATLLYLRNLGRTHLTHLGTVVGEASSLAAAGHFLLDHLFTHVEGMSNLKSLSFWQEVQA